MSKTFDKPVVKIPLLISLSVLFFSIPFLVPHTGFLILFAFVPLFFLDEYCLKHSIKRVWIYYYTVFLLWNFFTTFWLHHATLPGAIVAVVANALQMAVIFGLFRVFRKQLLKFNKISPTSTLPYLFFIATWLAWEHIYFNTQISWPWLVLGNAFATSIKCIQWYEFTGSLGGSLWALSSGLLLYKILSSRNSTMRVRVSRIVGYALLITLPIIASHIIYYSYKETPNPREFVVIQPNIEPYQTKFDPNSRVKQDSILFRLAELYITDTTTFVVTPETFTTQLDVDDPASSYSGLKVLEFNHRHPSSNFILGSISYKIYPWYQYAGSSPTRAPTLTAKKGNGYWYDTFNSAFMFDNLGGHDVFHKSKLVILVEFVPFPKLLSRFKMHLGGNMLSSYGTQPEISIFTAGDGTKIGTIICYESVYGDYCRGYVQKGAQVMSVITNDGWWGKTDGHKQHLSYSSLRAIELRRSIARSANTGISAFINQRGDITERIGWWEEGAIRGNLNLNDKQTLFVKYGDVVGKIAIFTFWLCIALFVSLFSMNLFKKKGKK